MCEVGEKDCRGVCTNDGLLFKSHDYNSYSFHNSRVVQYTVIIYINIYFQIRFSREARATLPNQQVYPQICFQRYHYRCHELEPSLSRKQTLKYSIISVPLESRLNMMSTGYTISQFGLPSLFQQRYTYFPILLDLKYIHQQFYGIDARFFDTIPGT